MGLDPRPLLAHLHGVVSGETPAECRWAEAYISALRVMAPRYGFGFVDLAGDLPRLVVFVSRRLTSRTGCTMRSLRNARRLWASRAWGSILPSP